MEMCGDSFDKTEMFSILTRPVKGCARIFAPKRLSLTLVSVLSLSVFAGSALAQAQSPDDVLLGDEIQENVSFDAVPQNIETPLRATTTTPAQQEALPDDLQTEYLFTPKSRNIDPASVKRLREESRNRWNPATLTQTTGLSAASYQATQGNSSRNKNPRTRGAMLTDVLSVQDLLNVGEMPLAIGESFSAAPSRQDGVMATGPSLQASLFDLPTSDNVNNSVFNLDVAGQICGGTSDECRSNEPQRIDVGFAKNITRGKTNGFNFQLTPRARLRFDENSKSALVGALVRIGDNLREGSTSKSNAWYLFAGADAQTISYSPNSTERLSSSGFHLQDRILVNDAQVGVGYRIGTADFAVTYFKRQASASDFDFDEDAAALSITWKR
jgi:hypothetical protein